MQYTAQPIGRARVYPRVELAIIVTSMGRKVDESDDVADLARKINRAIVHGTPNYLRNLKNLRHYSRFADATGAHVRGYITGKNDTFAG